MAEPARNLADDEGDKSPKKIKATLKIVQGEGKGDGIPAGKLSAAKGPRRRRPAKKPAGGSGSRPRHLSVVPDAPDDSTGSSVGNGGQAPVFAPPNASDRIADGNIDDDGNPTLEDEDSKDASDSEEAKENSNSEAPDSSNSANEIPFKENDATPEDGQDKSGVSDDELNKFGFANDPDKGSWANATDQAKRNAQIKKNNSKKKKGIYALVGGIGVTLAVVGAFLAIPQLAMNNALDKLTSRFSDRMSYAVEKRFDKYVGKYVTKNVAPSLKDGRCGKTLTASCIKVNESTGLVRTAITGWNDARLESRLEKSAGVTFQRRADTNEIDLVGRDGKVLTSFGQRISSRQLEDLIRKETNYEGVLKRRHLRSVGSRYGVKWCLSFVVNEKICGARNKADELNTRFSAFKRRQLLMIARVAEPISTRGGAVLFCMLQSSCDIDKNTGLEDSLKLLGKADDEAFRKIVDEIGDKKVSQYLVDKILDITIRQALPKVATAISSAATGVGAIYGAAIILDLIDRFDTAIDSGALKAFILDRNAQAAMLFMSTIVSGIEEAQDFSVGMPEISATFQQLTGFNVSRFYQSLASGEPTSELSCNDGYLIPKDSPELVCPENSLQPDVPVEEFLSGPEFQFATDHLLKEWRTCYIFSLKGGCAETVGDTARRGLKAVDGVFGAVGGLISFAINKIPGVSSFTEYLGTHFASVLNTVINKGLPISVDATAVGWRAFDQMAAAFDYSYNQLLGGYQDEQGQFQGFGAGEISEEDAEELDVAIADWRGEKLQSQSVFARYLDVTNPDSLAATSLTRVSFALPFAGQASQLPSPVNFASLFGGLLGNKASAAVPSSVYSESNFGVTQHAFTVEQLETDPEELTEEFCAEEKAAFAEARENDKAATSLCMLDEAMVDMVTKAFSPDPPGTSISTLVGTQSSFTGLDGPTIPYNQHETPTTVVRTGRYADWSGLTPTGVLGQNSAGQPINVYVRNAAPNISEPRRVVIGTSIHGSENAGQFLVHELLYNTDLPDDVELIAIPEINKSGVPFSKRKNATGTDESNRSDITIGVDLNRNWDYNWSSAGSTDPTNKNYRGTEPESEPETKAVADFLRSLGKVDLFASFHANLDYVAPVGNTPIEVAVAYSSRSGMNVGNGRTQYVEQSGSMDAWFNSLTGSPTLLVELSSSDSRAYIHKQVNSMLEAIDALP